MKVNIDSESMTSFNRNISFINSLSLVKSLAFVLLLSNVLNVLTPLVVEAASTSNSSVGSSASLDPVSNKANRLQMQGASGVDQSTGAFTYSYPITVPAGRNGMAPNLSLNYNSQNSDSGLVGYAWTLNTPYIERANRTGIDKLYTGDSANVNKPADTATLGNYFVSSLHGEIISKDSYNYYQKVDDGSYAQYTYNNSFWIMKDRDGNVYYFGDNDESKVQGGDKKKTGRWYLHEMRDKFGNGIIYNYKKDSQFSTATNTNQILNPVSNSLISSITYTDHALARPLHTIYFNYEDKVDKSVSYKYAFPLTDNKRLAYIRINSNGKDVAYYSLGYITGSNGARSMLGRIEEKHLGTDGEWTTIPPTTLQYEKSEMSFSGMITNATDPYGANSFILDINRDGINEATSSISGAVNTIVIDTNGDFKKEMLSGYNPSVYVVNDVNADGFDDILNGDAVSPLIAINDSKGKFVQAASPFSININTAQLVDMNGDGLTDKVVKSASGNDTLYSIYYNNGSGYEASSSLSWYAGIQYSGYESIDNGVRFVDVNNDGLVDIIRSYNSTYNNGLGYMGYGVIPIQQDVNKIYLNTGTNFKESNTKLNGYIVKYSVRPEVSAYTMSSTREYDTNGDNTTDYDGATNVTKKQDILKNINSPLGAQSSIDYKWTTADVVPGYGSTVSNNTNSLNPTLPIPTYVVSSVTDKLSANVNANGLSNGNALANVADNAINNDSIHKVTYKFADGVVYFNPDSPRDRRIAGFGRVEVVDGLQKSVTYYHQGNGDNVSTGEKGDSYDNIGRAYRSDTYDMSNVSSLSNYISSNVINNTGILKTQDWNLYKSYASASSTFTYIDSKVSNIYNNVTSNNLINNNNSAVLTYTSIGSKYIYDEAKRLIKNSYDYGEINNFISFASSTIADAGSDMIITNYEYTNSRPQRLVKKESMDMIGKLLDTTTYNYDGLPVGLATYGAKTSEQQMVYNSDGSVYEFKYKNNFTYDATGNVLTQTDIQGRTTRYTYDNNYLLPTRITDANGKSTTITYDPALLVAKITQGPDGIKSIKEYDGLGRVTKSYIQANTNAVTDQIKNNYVYTGVGFTLYNTKIGVGNNQLGGGNVRSMIAYDAWGREIQSKVEKSPELFETLITKYNNLSQVMSKSMPFESYGYGLTTEKSVNGETTYTYDALGRVVTVASGDNITSYNYDGKTVLVADNAKTVHKKKYVYDSRSNLAQVVEFNGDIPQTTSYTYNVLGKLTRITDANSNVRNFDYISNGLATYIEDAHSTYDNTFTAYRLKYDNLGRLSQKSGPLGTESYVYDNIDRLTTRKVFDKGNRATTTYSYVYDVCNNVYSAPCQVNRNNSSTTLSYNQFGMLGNETWKIDNKTFARTYVYDDFNRLLSVTNPDNGKIVYTYNMLGRQSSVSYIDPSGKNNPIVTDTTWNSWGGLTGMRYANGVQMCNTYTTMSDMGAMAPKLQSSSYIFNTTGCDLGKNNDKEPNSIKLYSDTLSYPDSYSPKSINTSIKDLKGVSHSYDQNFAYDGLGRLTSAIAKYDGLATSSSAWSYDAIGNMTSENGIKYNYSTDGYQNPNAVTAIGDTHLAYDTQGNRIQSGNSKYMWNSMNQMTSASTTDGTELYSYDDGGERIKRTVIANKIIEMKTKPTASSTNYFVDNGLLSNFNVNASNTPNLYISTSTYNRLSAIGMLNRDTLYALANGYYTSPFTAKYCSGAPSASRSTCIASTTEQLLASTLASTSLATIATTSMSRSLIAESMMVAKGLARIPGSGLTPSPSPIESGTTPEVYLSLATSTILNATSTTYILNQTLITGYKNYLATGLADVMTFDYNNVPLVSTSTYASLAQVSLLDNINLKKVVKFGGCTNTTPTLALPQGEGTIQCLKIIYGKYSLENNIQLSDQTLNEMYLVYQNKAKVPASYGDYVSYKFGVVGNKEKGSFVTVTGATSTTQTPSLTLPQGAGTTTATSTQATSTIDKIYRDLYGARLMLEPRLQYVNTFPYYVTQNTFTELSNAGVDQNTFENYLSTLDRLGILQTNTFTPSPTLPSGNGATQNANSANGGYILTSASSTEVMYAIKSIIYYEKGITISDTAARELYFVYLGLGTIPKSIASYTENASFDVSGYLTAASYYRQYYTVYKYSDDCSPYTGSWYGSGITARCFIRTNQFSLPIANDTSTTIKYVLTMYPGFVGTYGSMPVGKAYVPTTMAGGHNSSLPNYNKIFPGYTNSSDYLSLSLDISEVVKENMSGDLSSNLMIENNIETRGNVGVHENYSSNKYQLIAYATTARKTLADSPVYYSSIDPTLPDPRAIAYWKFDNNGKDIAANRSISENNVNYVLNCGFASSSACFNRTNSDIKLKNPISLANKNWTVSFDVNYSSFTQNQSQIVLGRSNTSFASAGYFDATSYFFGMYGNSPEFGLGYSSGNRYLYGDILYSIILKPNTDYNMRYTYDGTNVNLYINGVLSYTLAVPNMNINEVADTHIGSLNGNTEFLGAGLKNLFILNYATSTGVPILTDGSAMLGLRGLLATSTRTSIDTPLANYYGKVKEDVNVSTGTTTPMYVSEQTYVEMQKTNLKTPYDIAKVFSATTTDYCSQVASTTECDKQSRIASAKSLIGYMTGYVPSSAAMEELWMSYKGTLQSPVMATTTTYVPGLLASGTMAMWPLATSSTEVSGTFNSSVSSNMNYGTNCGVASSSACLSNSDIKVNTPLSLSNKNWTVAYTVKFPTAQAGNTIHIARHDGLSWASTSYFMGTVDSNPWIVLANAGGGAGFNVNSSQVLQPNILYNLRYTYDGINVKLYINGSNTDTWAVNNMNLNEVSDLHIGSLNNQWYWYNGAMKDIFVLGYASSTASPYNATSSSSIVWDRYAYDLLPHFDRSKLPATLSTIAGTSTVDLTKVPVGLLTDSQFGTLFATSSLAMATATRVISEATYNEMLHTPLRTLGDVKVLFDYVGTSTPTSTAQATLGLIGSYRPSAAAMDELYQVYTGKLAIIPTYNFATSSEVMTMNVRGRIDLAKSIGTSTYMRLPRVNTAFNNLNLTLITDNPYVSSSLSYVLRYVTATTTPSPTLPQGAGATQTPATSTQSSSATTTGTAASSSSAFMMTLASTTQIGILYGTSSNNTHVFDLSQVYNNYLAVPHGDLAFSPNFVNASGTIINTGPSPALPTMEGATQNATNTATTSATITTATLSFRRDVTVQPIVYDASLQAVANDRLAGYSGLTSEALAKLVATSSTMIDIDRAPKLSFTSAFFTPMTLSKVGTTTVITSTPTFYKSLEIPIVNMSLSNYNFYHYNCQDQYANGSVTNDFNNCIIGNGMYRGVVAALELKLDKATLATERAKGNKVFLTFKVVSTPNSLSGPSATPTALPLGTPVTICLMMNAQSNSNCVLDPNTRATTTARVGDIASLPLEYFLDNTTWPDPYTLTAVRVGIDYSTNPNAGIYLSNAIQPFVSIVTGSYVANSTSVTNAVATKNTADTAITFSYDSYNDEASRAFGLGQAPLPAIALATAGPSYLPPIAYPFATSTATTTLNTLSSATTTSYTEYTPFGGYTLDTRGFTTTDISINGNVVARYVYQPSQNATAGTASSTSSAPTLTSPGSGEVPLSGTLTFVHTSYLGTPVLETDQKGDIVYIALTDINGNTILRDERNDSTLQNKIYTGHRYDNVTQLTYAHARYLDTRTHTFTSVDPLYYQLSSAQLYNPQLMNAYSYANNNPVSNTDPTGLWSVSKAFNYVSGKVAAVAGFAAGAVTSAIKGVVSTASMVSNFAYGMATNPTATWNNASVSVYKAFNPAVNFVSNNSASTIASTALNYTSSSLSSSFSQTINASSYSQGYAAGGGLMGTIALTVVTLGAGGLVNAAGKAGSIGDGIVALNNASKVVNTASNVINEAKSASYVSKIDRQAFRIQRGNFWKDEVINNPSKYSTEDLIRMKSGRAPIGSDGKAMELHHENGTGDSPLIPMTMTEHRGGENYRSNHPWLFNQ